LKRSTPRNRPTAARVALGRRLKDARARHQLGQEEAGELLGVTHSAIGQWERGNVLIGSLNLILAAQHYGESLDWLVFGTKGNPEQRKGTKWFAADKPQSAASREAA
jgi:transcriptional regulator with XRE-family HTH domain